MTNTITNKAKKKKQQSFPEYRPQFFNGRRVLFDNYSKRFLTSFSKEFWDSLEDVCKNRLLTESGSNYVQVTIIGNKKLPDDFPVDKWEWQIPPFTFKEYPVGILVGNCLISRLAQWMYDNGKISWKPSDIIDLKNDFNVMSNKILSLGDLDDLINL